VKILSAALACAVTALLVPVHAQDAPKTPTADREPAALGTIDRAVRDFSLTNITAKDGKESRVTLSEYRGKKVVALIFVGGRCPMTWAYTERMKALAKEYEPRGVAILAVHSHFEESNAETLKSYRTQGWTIPLLDDKAKQEVANYYGVVSTPTFVLIDRAGVLRYRGAFEKQSDATILYVPPALDAILSGKEVPVKRSTAYGCGLPRRGA
jgi:peroxiredoxin